MSKICVNCGKENSDKAEECAGCKSNEFYADDFKEPEPEPEPEKEIKQIPVSDLEYLKSQRDEIIEKINRGKIEDIYELKLIRKELSELNKKIKEVEQPQLKIPKIIIPPEEPKIILPPEIEDRMRMKETEQEQVKNKPIIESQLIDSLSPAPKIIIPEPEPKKDFGTIVTEKLKEKELENIDLSVLIEQQRKTQILIIFFMIISFILYLLSISF